VSGDNNKNNDAQTSGMSSTQHVPSSAASFANAIETLQAMHEEQERQNETHKSETSRLEKAIVAKDEERRQRDRDHTLEIYRLLDSGTITFTWQKRQEQAHKTELERLQKTILTKNARIGELEQAVHGHQTPAHDDFPTEQVKTREGSAVPTTSNRASLDLIERYCYCLGEEYGDMVACDNSECERTWFHVEHTNLQTLPDEEQSWFCTLCRGWEAELDTKDDCWRCPKCGYEILDEDEDYDEGTCPKRAPRACDMCRLEQGTPWQPDDFDSASEDSEEDEDESDDESDDEADDDDIEHDVDPEDDEMDYDDAKGLNEGAENVEGNEDGEDDDDDDEDDSIGDDKSSCST